jgi:hypothetical protein
MLKAPLFRHSVLGLRIIAGELVTFTKQGESTKWGIENRTGGCFGQLLKVQYRGLRGALKRDRWI